MGTLDFYESNAEGYCESTFDIDMSESRGVFLNLLEKGSSVLDLGCGSGRDAKAFADEGMVVTAVDGSPAMCRIAARNTRLEVRNIRFSELDYDGDFDAVWACASLLHVPLAELPGVLESVNRALKKWGLFFCCFKKGFGERTDGERHYTDFLSDQLSEMLSSNGFLPVRIWESAGTNGTVWVNSISRKAEI